MMASPLNETPSNNRQMDLMAKARATASFDSRQLTYIIYGGEKAVKLREAVLSRIDTILGETDPAILPRVYGELSRTGLYHDGFRFGKALLEDTLKYHHEYFHHSTHRYTLINSSPFGLHVVMFIPTLKLQADSEQLAHWLPLAESGRILGTYCQTELGHGTFVRGLETTATFDLDRDEFIIHSPTVTSTKYWPGGLGYSSSHAIVMARLIVDGTDYGIHAFMVQIRSLDDFKPVPGIELGDIGLKVGLNSADNGYAIFNNVRIPRMHMMMRNARLTRDGQYITTQKSHSKKSYGTMVYARTYLVRGVAFQLAQAVTIAIRYSTVREQGSLHFGSSSSEEMAIIDFQSQRYRLLAILSRSFAIYFASRTCEALYNELVSRQERGDNSTAAYAHITTAALKAYASQNAADGSEDARRCCGGHGYSELSGLPGIVASVTSTVTLEGENYVMYQQTARYLVKTAAAIRRGDEVDSSMEYLVEGHRKMLSRSDKCCLAGSREFLEQRVQIDIFRHRAVRMVFESQALLQHAETVGKMASQDAWNKHMMILISAARAHIELFVLQSFTEAISQIQDEAVRSILKQVCDLFVLSTIESPLSVGALGFFEDSYISSSQLREIREHIHNILTRLVPEAIGLTDAWNFSDTSLQSALGRRDGNVYETMLSWTRQIPINQSNNTTGGIDQAGFANYIQPFLRSKL